MSGAVSSPTPPVTVSRARRLPTAVSLVAAVVSASVVSVLLSTAIAAIAHHAGVSHDLKALTVQAFASLTVFGLLIAAIAWAVIRRRATDPARVLGRLAPAVVLVSLIPDLLVGAGTGSMAGASWGGAVALMAMHLVVAAAGIAALQFFLPLPPARPSAAL